MKAWRAGLGADAQVRGGRGSGTARARLPRAAAAAGCHRLRLLAASPTSSASGRCCAGSHGDGYRAGAAGHAGQGPAAAVPRLDAGRCHGQGACGASPSPRPTSPRSSPTSCSCRCWHSTARAGGSATAAASTTARCAACARARPIVAVGLAFDEQQVDAVPHLDYDERLDWVLTPVGPAPVSRASSMRLLFLGDVVGRSGRQAVLEELPKLRARYKLDFVAVNGENAAGGFGITEAIFERPARRRRRRGHARQPRLRPEGGAGVHRAPAAAAAARSTIRPARPGKGAGLFKAAQRRRRAGHQRHGPDLHAGARLTRSAPSSARSRPAASSRAPTPS